MDDLNLVELLHDENWRLVKTKSEVNQSIAWTSFCERQGNDVLNQKIETFSLDIIIILYC